MNTEIIDVLSTAQLCGDAAYKNVPLTTVNDHVIRLSVMTEAYYWHYHPNSDETFQVLEGSIFIDLHNQTIELTQGQLFTIAKGIKHRTRPKGERSINITFEKADMETVPCDDPSARQ